MNHIQSQKMKKHIRAYIEHIPKQTCVMCAENNATETVSVNLGNFEPTTEVIACESCLQDSKVTTETRSGYTQVSHPALTEYIRFIYYFLDHTTLSAQIETVTGDLTVGNTTYITTQDTKTNTTKPLKEYITTHSDQVSAMLSNKITGDNLALLYDPDTKSLCVIFLHTGTTLVIKDFSITTNDPVDYCCFNHFSKHFTVFFPLLNYINKQSTVWEVTELEETIRTKYIAQTI